MRRLLGLCFAFAIIPTMCLAATSRTEQVEAAAKSGKYTYVMFYRANDNATKRMANTISSHVSETSEKTTWVTVNVRDRKEAELVKRFDASRIPLPAVFGVAPNGAVTGVFRQKVDQGQLTRAILTPQYSDMIKSLQSQKIAVVCLMPTVDTPVPSCVTALKQDPAFKGKLHEVKAYASDAAEAEFFSRMHVDQKLNAPVVLMFAPPGTHLGTFASTVSAEELAQTLPKSGTCNCDKCQNK